MAKKSANSGGAPTPLAPLVRGEYLVTPEQQELVERLARRVARLDLAMVAIFLIESVRPLNFVGSQLMHFFSPIVYTFGDFQDYRVLAELLQERESVDYLLDAIETEERRKESDAAAAK